VRTALVSVVLAACGRVEFEGLSRLDAPTQVLACASLGPSSGTQTCVIRDDRTLWCRSYNYWGEVGDGTTVQRDDLVQVMDDVSFVSGGESNTCAIRGDGSAWCWGRNEHGETGDGSTEPRTSPTLVQGLSGVAEIATGQYHTCARTTAGDVYCWGDNTKGELGDGTTQTHLVPNRVPGLAGVIAIGSNDFVTCAQTAAGLYCWGGAGWVGNGTTGMDQLSPAPVTLTSPVISVTTSCHLQTCVVLEDTTAWCWGENGMGQIGDGTMGVDHPAPSRVGGLTGVAEIAVGAYHACARMIDGSVYCWGDDAYGQRTGAAGSPASTPIRVPFVDDVDELQVGCLHTCVRPGAEGVCRGTNGNPPGLHPPTVLPIPRC